MDLTWKCTRNSHPLLTADGFWYTIPITNNDQFKIQHARNPKLILTNLLNLVWFWCNMHSARTPDISSLFHTYSSFKVYYYNKSLCYDFQETALFISAWWWYWECWSRCDILETWDKTTRSPFLHEHTIWYRSDVYAHLIGSCVWN